MSFWQTFKDDYNAVAEGNTDDSEPVSLPSECYKCKRRPKFQGMDLCERCWDKSTESHAENGPDAIISLCQTLNKHLSVSFSYGKHRDVWNRITHTLEAAISHLACEELEIKEKQLGGQSKIHPELFDLCRDNVVTTEQMVFDVLKPLWTLKKKFPTKSLF